MNSHNGPSISAAVAVARLVVDPRKGWRWRRSAAARLGWEVHGRGVLARLYDSEIRAHLIEAPIVAVVIEGLCETKP